MKKGWVVRETLLVIIVVLVLFIFIFPKYIKTTKRAAASEAVRTIFLLRDALNSYYLQNGVFSLDVEELGVNRLNETEGINFTYHIIGTNIDKYEIVANGGAATMARGVMVVYNAPKNVYRVEYLGEVIDSLNKQ